LKHENNNTHHYHTGGFNNNRHEGGEYEEKYNIPEYKEPMNNPMISNEQKRIFYDNKNAQGPRTDPNQLINLQIYQPKSKPPPSSNRPNPAVFYPNYVPNPFDPISYAHNHQNVAYGAQFQQPIFKEYNINIGGIAGSQLRTAMFFEDALPVKNVSGTFCSIGERVTMYESIRSNLFSSGDGKDVPIENDSYNLLSHLKLMDMNPYNASRFFKNPYKGLPFGFLLYRSCYPMRHDFKSANGICAPNSTGVNVRIYRLTEGTYMVNKQNITCISDHDEWRDMAFYNFIKEHIIKKKVCPNFPLMYGYNVALNSHVNFDDVRAFQDRSGVEEARTTDVSQFTSGWGMNQGLNQVNTKKALDALRKTNNKDQAMPTNTMIPVGNLGDNTGRLKQVVSVVRDGRTGLVTGEITNVPTPHEQAIMLNKYQGKALVCLTEAANYSIIGWAKKEYRADGNIKTMINSGYHTKTVWESVIFQMLVGLYVMQLKGVIINNFRIDRNVFIKDVSIGGTVTNYWKYKIEGIEYYIPNCGYLVLIDSNFRDFDTKCNDQSAIDPKRERKIDGPFIGSCKLSSDQCIEKSFEMFRKAIDPNTYDQDFVNDNGIKPPEEILRLLSNMKNLADSKPTLNIAFYIRTFMTMFMNNRIGGPLTEVEIKNVKQGAAKDFHKGMIVVMTDVDGVDKFVIHVKRKDGMISRIITRDRIDPNQSNFVEKDVPTSSLNEYSIVEPITQNFKINESNLNDESLIETYNVE
jgi:hypothetical protein